jgi:histidinol-phosphate aminotransferase
MNKGHLNPIELLRARLPLVEGVTWNLCRDPTRIELQFGENQEDISDRVLASIGGVGHQLWKYPDLLSGLIAAISKHKHLEESTITVINGTDEAFRLLTEVFIECDDRCMLFPPTYPSIMAGVRLMGGKMQKLGLSANFRLPPLRAISSSLSPNTKLIYLANPNTPTGNFVATREEIVELLSLPVIVIVDECYYELSECTVADMIHEHSNLIVTRSFSKTYGLAGLRMAYIVAHPELTQILRHVEMSLEPFPPAPSMSGAIGALEDEAHLRINLERLKRARSLLHKGLRELGIKVFPSETTALLIDTASVSLTGDQFVQSLAKHGVLTKTCEIYENSRETWVYFGVPRLNQVELVLERVRSALAAA